MYSGKFGGSRRKDEEPPFPQFKRDGRPLEQLTLPRWARALCSGTREIGGHFRKGYLEASLTSKAWKRINEHKELKVLIATLYPPVLTTTKACGPFGTVGLVQICASPALRQRQPKV